MPGCPFGLVGLPGLVEPLNGAGYFRLKVTWEPFEPSDSAGPNERLGPCGVVGLLGPFEPADSGGPNERLGLFGQVGPLRPFEPADSAGLHVLWRPVLPAGNHGRAFFRVNPEPPMCYAFPNGCFFSRCSSLLGLVGGVFVGSPRRALASDVPDSRSSNLKVCLHKKRGPPDSNPNPSHSNGNGTSALPRDATTNRRRKRFPHPNRGLHKHRFRAGQPFPEAR